MKEQIILTDIMNYYRDLIIENEQLKNQNAELRKTFHEMKNHIQELKMENENLRSLSASPKEILDEKPEQKSVIDDMGELWKGFKADIKESLYSKKKSSPAKKEEKRGSQVYVDINVGELFLKNLKKDGISITKAAQSMMYIFCDRSRYRNIISNRIEEKTWLPQSQRPTVSFGWLYPVSLGEDFKNICSKHKVKQYQVMEEMANEYNSNSWMRNLVKQYMNTNN